MKSNFKKKNFKKKHGTRVSCKISHITRFSSNQVFFFFFFFFLLKLNFLKIEFQNKSILLNSFRIWAFCYIFWTKEANIHNGETNFSLKRYYMGCMDAAPKPSHPHPMRWHERDTADRASLLRQVASCHVDSPTRTDVAQIKPTWPKLSKWPVQAEIAESGRNSKKKKGAKRTVWT